MKVAIIGAGVCGLTALRYLKDSEHECDLFEQTEQLGGTWVYDERSGTDENGLPICRVMYKNLITNIPKELMVISDFPYPSHLKDSYIAQEDVLKYIGDYATKFDLEKHIQYCALVTKVEPKGNEWEVVVMDVRTKKEQTKFYDAVFVCNGSNLHPHQVQIEGQTLFRGSQIHSCDYRDANAYKNKRVLIIGGSFSAFDIARQVVAVAKNVCVSHWKTLSHNIENVITKPGIKQLCNESAIFNDESTEEFDAIIYCTGYEPFYPFLTHKCGIQVEDHWVRYLYKHTICIENPHLYFIGIPSHVPVFINADIQARFSVAALDGKFVLPSKDEMLKDTIDHINQMKKENVPQRMFHSLGYNFREYVNDLSKTAGIRGISESRLSINEYIIETIYTSQRNTKFILLDEEKFIEIK